MTYSVLTRSEMYFSSPCCAAAAIFQHSAAVLTLASSNLAWVCVRRWQVASGHCSSQGGEQ